LENSTASAGECVVIDLQPQFTPQSTVKHPEIVEAASAIPLRASKQDNVVTDLLTDPTAALAPRLGFQHLSVDLRMVVIRIMGQFILAESIKYVVG
jgi:hypothetical protein